MIVLVLRRLPEAQTLTPDELKKETVETKLEEKGIPTKNINKLWAKFKFWLHKIWNLALEAKDLSPKPAAYNLKKLFQLKTSPKVFEKPKSAPQLLTDANLETREKHEAVSEQELLEAIKREPKNHTHYDHLAKFYLTRHQYQDAKDIYMYLVGHEVGNPVFHARLAQTAFLLKDFNLAESHFEKSLALDKMHPNRYYNLGLSQECQEKWQKAADSFTKALEMEPQNLKYQAALEKVKKQIE
jgi:tetratricopeptide (TPR) repeat protein